MDDSPAFDALYDPSLAFPSDSLIESPLAVNGSDTPASDSVDSPDFGSAGGSGAIGKALGALGSNPSARFLALLLPALIPLIGPLTNGVEAVSKSHPIKVVEATLQHIAKAEHLNGVVNGNLWQWFINLSFGKLFESMLHDGLGVDPGKFTPDEHAAMRTVDTMLGWAAGLMFVVSAVNSAGKILLGGRWPESLHETLGKLPEELGVSWALGLTVDEAFKSAQGVVLTEGINKQKRPNRIEWPQLRTLFKQHIITDEGQLRDLLAAQGFPDTQIEWLLKLKDVQLPVGDISQLFFRGVIDGDEAKRLISELGFDAHATDMIYELYVSKSENEASVTYRTIAGRLFLNHLIPEGQYRDILTQAHFPERLIDQNVTAFKLEQETGRVLHTVSALKSQFEHGAINAAGVAQALRELNYAPGDIADIIASWSVQPLRKQHGLSQAKILSYFVSGVINEASAREMLAGTGLTPAAVDLLIAHPASNARTTLHKANAGLVTQAFLDGAISLAALPDAYKAVNVDPSAIPLYVQVAVHRASEKKYGANADIPLSRGDWEGAFKNGLIDFAGLVAGLEHIGYNPDNAMLLAEIANKGPNLPARPSDFKSLLEAIEYMTSHGYNVIPPPDPLLIEAEGILAAHGYSWQKAVPGPGVPPPPPPVPIPG